MNKPSLIRLLFCCLPVYLLACEPANSDLPQKDTLYITNGWTRPYQPEAGATTAVYFTLHNPTNQPTQLTGAQVVLADTVEIHESKVTDGLMRMRPLSKMDVPANTSLNFKPGGHHLMVKDLSQALTVDDTLSVTLLFNQTSLTFRAKVQWSEE